MTDASTGGIPTFSTASAAWFADHERCIKPNTADSYNDALKPLCKFLGEKPINEIEIVHIRMYQDLRKARAGAHAINREVGVLQQILREFGEWRRLEARYRQLKEPPRRAGHSLTTEEEQRLREVAFTNPKWRLAAHCMMVMLSTGMGFGELRHVRRRDISMKRKRVVVRDGAKVRTFPLSSAAHESMTWILERWEKLGGCDPEHYILPHYARREKASYRRKAIPWILDEPMLTISKAFRRIRKAADLPAFRVDDCRTQAIAKLLSDGIVQGQHLSGQSDNDGSQRGTGNLICFPVRGGAA
jgi:site-specific recombinase XerD